MDSTILEKYFNENERLLNTEEFYDVKIYLGVEPNINEVHAHASIISAHCPFFSSVLNSATKENGYYIVKKADINEKYFKSILKFLYTCKIEIEDYSSSEVLELLITTDKLGIESLYECIMKCFIKKHGDYIKENPVKTLQLIYANEKFIELKNIYLKEFCKHSEKLFEFEFELLEKPVLLEILKRDDFPVDEIVTWENILKWGLAKHPEINNINVEDWSSQNFADLGNTLKEFVFLIRFQGISKDDFFNKIVPYQMIFPKVLWSNILQHYLFPDRQQNLSLLPSRSYSGFLNSTFESLTINQNLILLFASWIDKKSPEYGSLKEVKYEFKLIYRGSRDGLSADRFHKNCGIINKTLVVGKIQNSNQLVGGYNPLNWNGYAMHKNTTESFIFNVSNRNDINSAQFSYVVKNHDKAIYCHPPYFATFGGGWDLCFGLNSNIYSHSSSHSSYDNINIKDGSKYDELEVFQIIDKN